MWTNWGLDKDIWSIIEAGWAQDPLERPVIDLIIAKLEMKLDQDIRDGTDILSSIRFHQEVYEPIDVSNVTSILDSLTSVSINRDLPTENHPGPQPNIMLQSTENINSIDFVADP